MRVMLIAFIVSVLPVYSYAGDSSQEIEHLLNFVERSECVFVRNGTKHAGEEARAHLEKKYNYIKKRKSISKTEDFIQFTANKSSITGKVYTVICGERTLESSAWLQAELTRYRQAVKLK